MVAGSGMGRWGGGGAGVRGGRVWMTAGEPFNENIMPPSGHLHAVSHLPLRSPTFKQVTTTSVCLPCRPVPVPVQP